MKCALQKKYEFKNSSVGLCRLWGLVFGKFCFWLPKVFAGFGFKDANGFFLMKSRYIDDSVLKFLGELLNENKPPTILFSLESGIVDWCLKNKIRFQQRVPEGGGCGAAVERYLICDILGSTRSKYKVWRRSWPRRFKHLRVTEKAKSTDFKNFLYESAFYQTISLAVVLEKVIIALNKSVSGGSVEPHSISQGPLRPQSQEKAVLKGAALNVYFDKLLNETSPRGVLAPQEGAAAPLGAPLAPLCAHDAIPSRVFFLNSEKRFFTF